MRLDESPSNSGRVEQLKGRARVVETSVLEKVIQKPLAWDPWSREAEHEWQFVVQDVKAGVIFSPELIA